MTLSAERIKATLQTYWGQAFSPESDENALADLLCSECIRTAQQLLGERELTEPDCTLVEGWVAAEAFYELLLAGQAVLPQKFSTDGLELTVSGIAQARSLADAKRSAAAAVLGEGAFCFAAV